jgi:hypothetical protein
MCDPDPYGGLDPGRARDLLLARDLELEPWQLRLLDFWMSVGPNQHVELVIGRRRTYAVIVDD